MGAESRATQSPAALPSWHYTLSKYERSVPRKALWQILDTFIPYLALWLLMIGTVRLGFSYWLTLALAVPAAGLLVRIFIIFHDCCHGAFLASRRTNRILGHVAGILSFTAFDQWARAHAIHHATSGDLDRRGVGDVWTLTVEEYLAMPRMKRLAYRLYRNPAIILGLGPVYVFLVMQRVPQKGSGPRERTSVLLTDLAIAAVIVAATVTIGLRTYLLIQLPVMLMAGAVGAWLFYVQHQFVGVYWARHEDWDPIKAALEGSSYYTLPKVLQWFTGNIGLHHIHHLRPRIPNYRLQQCYDDTPAMQTITPLTIRASLTSLWLNLWDEADRRLVSFGSVRTRPQHSALRN